MRVPESGSLNNLLGFVRTNNPGLFISIRLVLLVRCFATAPFHIELCKQPQAPYPYADDFLPPTCPKCRESAARALQAQAEAAAAAAEQLKASALATCTVQQQPQPPVTAPTTKHGTKVK